MSSTRRWRTSIALLCAFALAWGPAYAETPKRTQTADSAWCERSYHLAPDTGGQWRLWDVAADGNVTTPVTWCRGDVLARPQLIRLLRERLELRTCRADLDAERKLREIDQREAAAIRVDLEKRWREAEEAAAKPVVVTRTHTDWLAVVGGAVLGAAVGVAVVLAVDR